jgi:hypothetical protein
MPTTLTGSTLVGSSSGSITGIENCQIGGLDVTKINYMTAGDTNALSNNIPGAGREGDMVLTIVYEKALQTTLRAKAKARTTETWTYTDAGGSTWSGTGFIQNVGGIDSDPESEDTFQLTLTPSSSWTFSAAA